MKKINKISSIIIFSISILVLIISSIMLKDDNNFNPHKIEIKNNLYLSEENYLQFAKLNNIEAIKLLNPSIVKDRIEKHPYVKYADVKLSGSGIIEINIYEKEIAFVFPNDQGEYLICEDFQIIPKLPFTKNINVPVLENPYIKGKVVINKKYISNEDITSAFKIRDAIKNLNTNMYELFSEIDLRQEKDILLYFSNLSFPVIVGRNNEAEKMVYLYTFFEKVNNDNIKENIDYLDLRFADLMYIGFNEQFWANEGKHI